MKKIINYYYIPVVFITTLFIGQGCINEQTEIYEFDLIRPFEKLVDSVYLEEISDNIITIPLQSNSDCYLTNIKKIIVYNNDFLILDYSGKKLLRFNSTGKFLNSYGTYGRGPGEFILIKDFIVDELTDRVQLYDLRQQKIIYYNLEGIFVNEEELNFKFQFFERLDSNRFIVQTRKIPNFYKNEEFNFDIFIFNDSTVLKSFFEYDPKAKTRGGAIDLTNIFTKNGNEILVAKLFVDTVYKVNYKTNLLTPTFLFDYGNHSIPDKSVLTNFEKELEICNNPMDCAFGHMIIGATDSVICFSFGYKEPIFEHRLLGFYDRRTKKTIAFKNVEIKTRRIVIEHAFFSQNKLFSYYYPQDISEMAGINSGSESSISDNPIIIISKINIEKLSL